MMDYLLKFMLCSAILYGFYHLLLRNDRSFRFNRYFLLGILVLALIIPGTIIRSTLVEVPITETFSTSAETMIIPTTSLQQVAIPPSPDWEGIAITVYSIIAMALALRLIIHLIALNRFKSGGKTIFTDGLKVVLRSDINHSFSFLGHIFTNKEAFENGAVPKEIIQHERAHVSQKHSYDILFMELMTCLFWFNPMVYLVKRAVKLNHEFLADESVIHQTGTLRQYQHIIINAASQHVGLKPTLASHLNYGATKKRIKIMVKTKNKFLSALKQLAALSIVFALFLSLGVERIIAQEIPVPPKEKKAPLAKLTEILPETPKKTVQHQQDIPYPPVKVVLYPKSKVRYKDPQGRLITSAFEELPAQVKDDFLALKLKGEIWLPPPPPAKITQTMLDEFLDEKKYGLWLNNEEVDNEELKNYEPKDFHHFIKSRLHKSAAHSSKHPYHLVMITQKRFDEEISQGRWIKFKQAFIPKPGEKTGNDEVFIKKKND